MRLDIEVNRCDNEGLGFCIGAPFHEGLFASLVVVRALMPVLLTLVAPTNAPGKWVQRVSIGGFTAVSRSGNAGAGDEVFANYVGV